MKKFLAFLLTFALLLVPFSTISFAAEAYTDVTLTGVNVRASAMSGDNWVAYLIADGYDCPDWSLKYEGLTIEYNGAKATTGQVSSAGGNQLYLTIPTSVIPATGGTFTIKAGQYEPDADTSTVGLNILNDITLTAVDGHIVQTTTIDPHSVETFGGNANSFYFRIRDALGQTITTGFESWENFITPANCDGYRLDPGENNSAWANAYSGVFVDDIVPDYWTENKNIGLKNVESGTFYVEGLNAVPGTEVVVRGHLVSSSQATWDIVGSYYLKEMKFTFDGTNWNATKTTEYTKMALAGIHGWGCASHFDTANNQWVLYLNTSDYLSTDWNLKYEGLTYVYNGVEGKTGQVSSTEENRLYCTIPGSAIPATDGVAFTIKAGQYAPDATGTTYGLDIINDFSVAYVGTTLISTQVISASNVEAFNNSEDDPTKSFYFSLKDSDGNAISTGLETWDNFLSPAHSDGTRIEADGWTTTYTGVFVDGAPKNYWDNGFKNVETGNFYIGGLSAVAGTTVTVRGYFASSTQADWIVVGNYYIDELNFTFDGTTWSLADDTSYTEHTGTPEFESENVVDGVLKGIFFTAGETAFPYDAANWTVTATAADDDESGVFLNGDKTSVYLKKVNEDSWYVCLSDAGVVLAEGDEITIVGSFIYGTHRITFEEYFYTYSAQEEPEDPLPTYTGTPVLHEQDGFGHSGGFYFTAEDGAPYAEDWSLRYTAANGDANGVFVNGTKTAITLKKIKENSWYVCISDAGVTLNVEDVLTIKGLFTSGDAVVNFNEASFEFNGKNFGEGEYTATDFTITGLGYKDIVYDSNLNRWNMYFTLSNNIPGDIDNTYYPYLTYEINGVEYTEHWFKSSTSHTVDGEVIYNLVIPMTQLPASLDQEYVITIKANSSQGRVTSGNTARADGIRLTEDYQFVVGGNYNAAAPAVNYLMGNGGNENGIYLSSADAFPTIGWDYSLTKLTADDGIYVNGEATDVFIKKYADGEYYVCLSDLGISATEGTIVMLKGAFTTANLNFVKFQTAKYIYTDGKWEAYSSVIEQPSTGVSGDANGDGKFNIMDLIRMKKFALGSVDEINIVDADLNGDGKINSNDITLVIKMLLGLVKYENGANITGVPTYADDAQMRLSAYVAPTLEEGFADYKAAGFTTLISEERAVYGTDGFEEYMNLAAENDLDVIVQSGFFQNMLTGNEALNTAWLKTMCEDLSKYENFRGIFMGDEPRIDQLDSYTSVTNALKFINPNMDLFTSCLPTYTPDESLISTDSSLSFDEKYSAYANAYGNLLGDFTYDFYPFRHSYREFLGQKFNEKDYMRSDWFKNLTLAAANAKGKYTTGITVQSYSEAINAKDHYRDVTKADVSFQVYSALAYGMKSINYFTYGEHWDPSVGTTSCMIYDGQKTNIYYAVQSVNNEIKAFDNVLLNFNWQGTIGIKGTNSNKIMNYVDAYSSKRISNATASDDAIIGCLKDSKGYDGFMLVNSTDPSANVTETISVTFNNADHAKVYINGVESIVELNGGTFSATLAPGQGIFVIPYIA